jgi:hypothetical protein
VSVAVDICNREVREDILEEVIMELRWLEGEKLFQV